MTGSRLEQQVSPGATPRRGRAPGPLRKRETDAAGALLEKVKPIGYDAYILGVGERTLSGSVSILRYGSHGLKEAFVAAYSRVAHDDVAAQLFSSTAGRTVLSIDTESCYAEKGSRRSGSGVGKLLRDEKIAQLLLSGVDSTRGMAWLTLYRLRKIREPKPFSTQECERASYVIRAALFEWQLASRAPIVAPVEDKRYELVQLTPMELQVALRLARGFTEPEIGASLGIAANTVHVHAQAVYRELGTRSEIADRLLGALPPVRRHRVGDAGADAQFTSGR
jgi:DNA-binding CsgD family transcriptional regulator